MRRIKSRILSNFLIDIIIYCLLIKASASAFKFNEELFIETLPDQNVNFRFQFTISFDPLTSNQSNNAQDFSLFPKSIGDIVNQFKITEFSLSLSQGTWKHVKWGMPSLSVPTGGEIWSIFDESLSSELVDTYWLESSRTISGLFGLSVNLIDNPNTVRPKYSIVSSSSNESTLNARYASLPNENICTENLTPWFKLLPCGKHRGLAQLFRHPHKLLQAQQLSTRLHFKQSCLDNDCLEKRWHLQQTLSLVFNIENLVKKSSYHQLNTQEKIIWSFSKLFDEKVQSFCPVAEQSLIFFDLSHKNAIYVKPTSEIETINPKKQVFIYDLKKLFELRKLKEIDPIVVLGQDSFNIDKVVTVHRFTLNANERNFGIKTAIQNRDATESFQVVYLETIPWYFKVFASSITIKENNRVIIKPDIVHFTPGLSYKRANHIEIKFTMKPNSSYAISFNCEYAYLKWDEYPPDVNHGFYVNPALITLFNSGQKEFWPQIRQFDNYETMNERLTANKFQSTRVYKIYSEAMLVNLPAPDFSMPYNVICLTCTVVAICFGSLHNFTTRRFKFLGSKSLKEKFLKIRNFLKK